MTRLKDAPFDTRIPDVVAGAAPVRHVRVAHRQSSAAPRLRRYMLRG